MPRLLAHRARAQSTLLLAVLAVTLVATTLLGTFALLLSTGETRAPQVALDRAAVQDTTIDLRAVVGQESPETVTARAAEALETLLADVPARVETWTSSPWLFAMGDEAVARTRIVYLADYPVVPEHATLVDGEWPTGSQVPGSYATPVAVPEAAADANGWKVGTDLRLTGTDVGADIPVRVVGVYRIDPPRALWTRDVLAGRVHDPDYPVPNTFGSVTTDAWGPFVVARDAGAVVPGVVRHVAYPDLDAATPAQLDALRVRLSTAQTDAYASVPAATVDLSTSLDRTLDTISASLGVTRVGVVVVGLLLLVVAVTVLLIAARLLAERRTAEQTLLTSRGASAPQLVGLAALEALGVAAVAAALAPWLAHLAYRALASAPLLRDAGLAVDPGTPATLWLTCAVAAALLAAVLLAPSLRRRVSAVDTEQQEVRQDRRQMFARSGVDLAVVVVAGVALWQLARHGSAVLDSSGDVDPLLVAAPALVLLAGGVVAGRVLPLVARVGELVAARSRALVAPLAAWQVSRRPHRAGGAVLLVTLAVATGTFAQGWLATWHVSQREQAELAVGTDLRVQDLDGTTLEQSARLAGVDDLVVVSPVARRQAQVAVATGAATLATGSPATLVALDTRHAGDLLRGRLDEGWAAAAASLAPTTVVTGAPVPADARQLALDLRFWTGQPVLAGRVTASLVLADARGARTTLDVGTFPPQSAPGIEDVSPLPVTVDLPEGLGATHVVGVTLRLSAPFASLELDDPDSWQIGVEGVVSDVRALDADGGETPVDLGRVRWRTASPSTWDPMMPGTRLGATWVDAGALHVTAVTDMGLITMGMGALFTTAFDREPIVHALVTPGMLETLSATQDDVLAVQVDGIDVQLRVDGVVPYLPSLPTGDGVLVDRDALTRATLVTGARDALVDEWWALVDDDAAPAAADAVTQAGVGAATTRVETAREATRGPLHVGIPAALWSVTLAAVALAVTGIALSATVAVRTRRLELARLQALGASRGALSRAVLGEYSLLGALGTAAGLAVGALLVRVVTPLVTVSDVGLAPVPAVLVEWPWPVLGTVVAAVAAGATLAVVVTTRALLRRTSGALLRLGDEG
ncbi:FtsX-like permease family protein [Cellulomonas palmilytica]|uniref:FtsX-like permease family protein n=1 Tax=Cellulomonas palmilytica TaxID=2608402 RepID=UPI001F23C44C|nr:FtsX-like permease family protein [Cellulomonas palmilytica]UJP41185.1 hypothetical protein F1D97_07015 [Cellulomonas palmilytica]